MAEYPILFNGSMVRAIIAGRKTQTRRILKSQPTPLAGGWMYDGKYFADDAQCRSYLFHDVYGEKGSPYGSAYADRTGDLLWVRETWIPTTKGDRVADYRATSEGREYAAPWKPSIHMPRWASRITLRVTDVRVERVQEISKDDAKAEGIYANAAGYLNAAPPFVGNLKYDYVTAFRTLWDSINAARGHGWESNPWVWVVSFKIEVPTP